MSLLVSDIGICTASQKKTEAESSVPPVEKKEKAQRFPTLLYACLERPRLVKQFLGQVNGYDLSKPLEVEPLDRPWTASEVLQAAAAEKKRMQRMLSAAGLEKIDPRTGKNYWEAEIKRWVPDRQLGVELANAEILTQLKEASLPMFWDEQVFAALRQKNEDLEERALKKAKDVMERWVVSIKILWVATEKAVDWLEEVGIAMKVEGREPGKGAEWKGAWRQLLGGKISFWQYVLELVHGPYDELTEHPFLWMHKLPRTELFPKKLEGDHPLDGVWRRLLLG